ncbi:MAG: hypothetical protein ACR2PV_03050 [Gammaproteobacteria bacterium]
MMSDDENETLENARTIYRQRYETFRHLDRMRWFLYGQIAVVSSAGGVSIFLRFSNVSTSTPLHGLFAIMIVLIGVVLVLSGIAMRRVAYGLHKNSVVLQKFGEKIGDSDIPITKTSPWSIAWWIQYAAILAGGALIAFSFLMNYC